MAADIGVWTEPAQTEMGGGVERREVKLLSHVKWKMGE